MGPLPIYNETHTNRTGVLVEEKGQPTNESLTWALICAIFSIVVFGCATIQYIRRRASSPKQRRKRKQREDAKRKAREEKSITAVSRDPIPVEDFIEVLTKKRKKGSLAIEFKALTRLQADPSCDAALLPANRKKNAYPEVLPFDHCRVTLDSLPGVPNSDYVNASYIDAYNKPKAYIAAQGPNRHTINDFWRMVWQENVRCIVMATNVFEHARQQCEKYWHNQHGRYGNIEVWLDNTDILADFNIRTFRVKRDGSTEERVIKQFQFANWSDHDCPNPSSVLEYRRRVRAYTRNKPGPLLVHCGSGAGRTGTFIGLDAMLDRLSTERNVDIFNYALFLRNSRMNMIRNLAQYEFIYDVVAMYLNCGTTVITAKELPAVVQKLAIKDPQLKMNGFEREYKTLQSVVPKLTVGECAGGHRAENRRKSRDIMLQPPERARPYLITHDSNDSTDYINAVYVDGYRHTNAYIVTQWPLKSTINDIWRLVYDYNIPTMVLLNDMPHSRSYPRFWPSTPGKEVPYGPLTIELESEHEEKSIVSRVFRIRKHLKYKDIPTHLLEAGEVTTLVSLQAMSSQTEESARTVKMFQLRSWPNNHKVPSSANALIDMLTKVEKWQLDDCNGRIPTCVISKNGVSRCGCYTAISIAWDKLKAEGEVDIFRAVKTIKANRPQLVENIVEYIYCYTFMVVLLDLLTTTQPHMIPRSETADLERWEERSKPLVPVDHARKGDPPQIICMKQGQGRSKLVPHSSSFSNQGFYADRPNSIERSRYGSEIEPAPFYLEREVVSPQSAQSAHLSSFPFPSFSSTPSPKEAVVHTVPVVVHHPGTPRETMPALPSSQSHPTSLQTLGVPLRQFDLDYSFENEAFSHDIAGSLNPEQSTAPSSSLSGHRLSTSTDMSFHTALDDLTDVDSLPDHRQTDAQWSDPHYHPLRPLPTRPSSRPHNVDQWRAPSYQRPAEKRPQENGVHYRQTDYLSSRGGIRRSISEISNKANIHSRCSQMYGEPRGEMGVVEGKELRSNGDQSGSQKSQEVLSGKYRINMKTLHELNNQSNYAKANSSAPNEQIAAHAVQVQNGTNTPKKHETSRKQSKKKLAQYSALYGKEALPLTDLHSQVEIANRNVYLQAPTVNIVQQNRTFIQPKESRNGVWSIPTIPSETMYRIPELNLGRSTFV